MLLTRQPGRDRVACIFGVRTKIYPVNKDYRMLSVDYKPKTLSCLNAAASSGNRPIVSHVTLLGPAGFWDSDVCDFTKTYQGICCILHPSRISIMCMHLALCMLRPSVTNDDLHSCMSIQQNFCCQNLKEKKSFRFQDSLDFRIVDKSSWA